METVQYSEYEINRTGGDGKGSGRVKPQDMALLQEKLFDTLVCFADFCEEHDIGYILAGGSCIGAVREHDFVPWDGDLDVAVLREDFDKLFDLWEKYGDKENYSLYRTTDDFCAYVPIGIMRNNNTTFIRVFEKGLEDRNLGVKIDIEPMDEIPDAPIKRRIQKFYALLHVAFLTQRVPRKKSKAITVGIAALLKIFRSQSSRNRILRITGKQIKKYNGTGCKKVAINGLGGISYRTDIAEPTKMLFHGRYFNIPAKYDEYLKWEYGDYMKKPPVEKRRFGDDPVYYDLNLPFRDYLNGIKENG